jgi:hypothetical protein
MINFLLLQVASILKLSLTPFGYGYGVVKALKNKEYNQYALNLALSKDRYGNALLGYAMNDLLINPHGYKFGNGLETISSALGKNQVAGTLTRFGRTIAGTLNAIDKDHCIKSIDNTIINKTNN